MGRVKKWLVLPFLGASSESEKKHRHTHDARPRANQAVNEDAVEIELSHKATVTDLANKDEEDIVQDYNSTCI